MANDQAWGFNLAEIDSPDANVRLFHYRILDKTYRVTLVQNDNITDTDWVSKKLGEANNSHERKYTLCVHGYWIQGSSFDHPDTFLFSFCCGSDILIWRTRRMGNMMYTYEIDSFLSI
ncbi:hypothetical protein PanWU01x14_039020 [Parasponia andersonii]|uniref:Uncharacterized protein n=1 Tax=Parasponia andersonii TaxID=3476 RepID=A0A2P5DRQ0_PARAD|nr:hypothetical protein PanWU01x14_039020 [Parasponia andersonii]